MKRDHTQSVLLLALKNSLLALCAFLFFSQNAFAATCPVTDGGAGDSDGSANGVVVINASTSWSPPSTNGDFLDCSAIDITITNNSTLTFNSTPASGLYGYLKVKNLTIDSGSSISADAKGCTSAWVSPYHGYAPNASNVCTINGTGAGAGSSGTVASSGGGHGGAGGVSSTAQAGGARYDSLTSPVYFGASGGSASTSTNLGGAGGGVLRLNVTGTFTHNGSLTANGAVGTSVSRGVGGGAGGSVNVTAGTLSGTTGTFSAAGANGGAVTTYYGGGGGGGRISVSYASGTFTFSNSNLIVTGGAAGGGAAAAGTKGTAYVKNTTASTATIYGDIIFDASTYASYDFSGEAITFDTSSTQTCLSTATTPSITATTLTMGGTFTCTAATGLTSLTLTSTTGALNMPSGTVINANVTGANLNLNLGAGTSSTWTDVTITGGAQGLLNIDDAASLSIAGTSTIAANANWTSLVDLNLGSSVTINANSKGCVGAGGISAGYAPNSSNVCTSGQTGAGSGIATSGATGSGGAGHGSPGGASAQAGGATYDSLTAPVLFGASGGAANGQAGGSGGGVIRINNTGTLTLNASISANGGAGSTTSRASGGGSGGSIYITTNTLAGSSGTLSATGGNGGVVSTTYYGGGGGGGRIAVTYASGSFTFSNSNLVVTGGTVSGGVAVAGSKGTAYVKNTTSSVSGFYGNLIFDASSYASYDFTGESMTFDASSTQTCLSTATAPSISASTLTMGGTLTCTAATGLTSLTLTSSTGALDMVSGTTINANITGANLNLNLGAGTSSTWSGVTLTGGAQGLINIDDAASLTVTGTSAITGNINWTSLVDLNLGSSVTINANSKGCVDTGADAHGYAPNSSNVCTYNATGSGQGTTATTTSGSGGGGHGGAGGAGVAHAGGAAYDTLTAPIYFGASGGSINALAGGTGGGVIRVNATGTLTLNGSLSANGGTGTAGSRAPGPGAGGSIYLTTGTIAGTTGTFSATGANGQSVSPYFSGGGGGGRIAVLYSTDSSSFLSSLSTTAVAGGTKGGGAAVDGSVGTVYTGINYPLASFSASSQSGAENGSALTVTVNLSSTYPSDVTVPVTLTGTATENTDYTISATSIVIPTGSTSGTFTITPINETRYEANETVILTMGSPTNAIQGTTTVHTATITNDDSVPTVSWNVSSQSVSEGAGTATITATLSNLTDNTVSIGYTNSGTATGSGGDYSITASPFTIAAGSSSASITVTLVDDTRDENNETVIVTMATYSNATAGANTVHTLTIEDNDPEPTASLSSTISSSGAESTASKTIAVTLSAASNLTVTVPYVLTGTATGGGVDYTDNTGGTVTFSAGSTTANISLTIVNDTSDENDETIIATISDPTNGGLGTYDNHTYTITDNDNPPTVSFASTSQTVSELIGTTTATINVSVVSGKDITIPFNFSGTATANTDCSLVANPLTIPAGSSTGTVTFNIIDDYTTELSETCTVTFGTLTNATNGANTAHTVTITDIEYAEPDAPTITAPIEGYYNISRTPTVTTSAFVSDGRTHTATDWKITTDLAGSNVVWSDDDDATNLLSVSVNDSNGTFSGALTGETQLAGFTTYYAFARHENVVGESSWSAPVSFTTVYVGSSLSNVWEFDSSDYIYNSSFVEVNTALNGLARLKDLGGATYGGGVMVGGEYYTHYKPVTITNAVATTKTNFQVRVPVTYDADMQADFDDVRFTANNGTVLDYWLQYKTDSTSAVFWVEVPTLTASADTTIKMYYGNASVATASSGFNTFEVFDDFETGSLDTNKWTATDSTATVSGGELVLVGNGTWNRYIALTNAIARDDLTLEMDYRATISGKNMMFGWMADGGTTYTDMVHAIGKVSNTSASRIWEDGTNRQETAGTFPDDNPYYIRISMKASSGALYQFSRDRATYTTLYNSSYSSESSLHPAVLVNATGNNYLDNIRVRKYLATEPSVSVGTEALNTQYSDISVTPTLPVEVKNIYALSHSLSGSAVYQMVVDGIPYWYDGSSWTVVVDDFSDNNTIDEINQHLPTLASDAGVSGGTNFDLGFTVFLLSPDGFTPSTLDFVSLDYDLGNTELTVSNVTVNENATTATLTVTASQSLGADMTVDYVTANATALSGADYTASSGTATITAGNTSTTLTVNITDDALDENDETFSVNFSNPSSGVSISDSSAIVTITDNDATPTVAFSSASQSFAEGSGSASITATLSAESALDVSVPYTVTGTATGSGTDYTLANGTISILAGNTSATLSVPVVSDALDENNETVVVTLGTPTNASAGATTVHTLTITDDDDAPTVDFSASSQSHTESGSMTVTATLSASSGLDVTLPFSVTGTATGAGTDYSITASPLTIPAGSTSTTITITITHDTLDEDNETIILTMDAPTNAGLGSVTEHTATITDNDAGPTVNFSSASQTVNEDAGSVDVSVSLSTASGKDVTVPFTLAGTATGSGTDYTITASPVTIPAGSTSTTITVNITDDAIDEANETVRISMGTVVNGTQGSTDLHIMTISDNDATPTVTLTSASQTALESGGSVTITAELSSASGLAVSIPFTLSGTATSGGTDYSITASPLTISAGSTTATATVTINNDVLDEDDETVVVTLGSPTNASLGATTEHTLTITDDDAMPSLSFTASSASANEGDGTATITVQLSQVSGRNISVPFSLSGTALGSGTDYSTTVSPLTIVAGSSSGTITVTLNDDNLDENNETILVDLDAPTGATLGATTSYSLTVADNDNVPTVSFSQASQTDVEGTDFTVTIESSVVSGRTVTVPFVVDVASTETDYTMAVSSVTIPAGSTSASFTVSTDDDLLDESSKTIILNLGTPTNADLGATTSQTITTTDDDASPTASFSASSQTVNENVGTVTLTAVLSDISGQDVELNYTVTGTATSAVDHNLSNGSVVITQGTNSQDFTFTVTNDALNENAETVIVTFSAYSGATAGATTVHTVTIADDDSLPSVQLSTASQTISEGIGSANFRLNLGAVSGRNVTVPYTISGSSTSADHSLVDGQAVITAGETYVDVDFNVTDDTDIEASETLIVTLGSPTYASLGATTSQTVTITDNESNPTVSLNVSELTRTEDAGQVSFSVNLSSVSAQSVSVPFSVSGTATFNTDFTVVSGSNPLVIAPGETSATVTLQITDDSSIENDETLIVTLDSPTHADLGAIQSFTLTIEDNDNPPLVSFDRSTQNVSENVGSASATVNLSYTSELDVTIPYTISGTSTSADHNLNQGTLTILAGESSGTINFNVTNDTLDENNETVIITFGTLTNGSPGTHTVQTITIIDNDASPQVSFATTSQTVAEDVGAVTASVQLSTVSGLDVTIPYTISGTVSGSDHNLSSGSLTVVAGDTSATVSLNVSDDILDENNETLIITLDTPTNASLGVNNAHTITITDNDSPPELEFSVGSSQVDEDVGTVSLTLELNTASGRDVVIPYTVSGTASSADHDLVSASATISAGSTSAQITINIVDDLGYENNETVIVTLGSVSEATLGANQEYTLTIADNDNVPSVEFVQASQSVGEDVNQITIELSVSVASSLDITVPYVVSGTSDSGDHDFVSGSVVITAGNTSANLTVNTTDDSLDEDDETLVVALSEPVNAILDDVIEHTVTITDNDDVPEVGFASASQTVAEDVGSASITFELSQISGRDVVANYTVAGTAGPLDRTLSNGQVIIEKGQISASLSVPITDDLIDENNETIIVNITDVENGVESLTVQHTITITDNDNPPTLAFSTESQTVSESIDTVNVTVSASEASAKTITVAVSASGTATGGDVDYTLDTTSLIIPAGETTATVQVSVVDDSVDENSETIVVGLLNPTNASLGALTSHTINVSDNDDEPAMTLDIASQTVDEGVGNVVVNFDLNRSSSQDVTFNYTLSGTATRNDDYDRDEPHSVTISAGAVHAEVQIALIDDDIDENSETIILTTLDLNHATQGAISSQTITVTDNDEAPEINWNASTQTVAEDVETVTVTASLGAVSSLNVSVPFTVTGTATASGTDHDLASGTINISAGSTSGTATFNVTDDLLDENNETVIVTLGSATNATVGATGVQTITITDNDAAPELNLSASTQTVAEDVGAVTVTANIDSASALAVSVPFTVTGTATGSGTDHDLANGTISISAGSTSGTATFSVTNDNLDENSETVIVTLGSATNATVGATGIQTITITDNDDAPTVSFTSATSDISESTAGASIALNLSAVSSFDVTIPYSVSGTSVAGEDYTALSGEVVIAHGETSGIIEVTLINDSILETDKTLIFNLGSPQHATLSNSGVLQYQLNILDDESDPSVLLTSDLTSASEDGGVVEIIATLEFASYQDVTVVLSLDGDLSETEYSINEVNLLIPAGELQASTTMVFIDDDVDEDDENINVSIDSVVHGIEAIDQSIVLSVEDNDEAQVVVVQTGESTDIVEGGSTDTYTVVLESEPTSDVEILMVTTEDLNLNSDSLVFTSSNWSTPQTVEVSAVDDDRFESNHSGDVVFEIQSEDLFYNGIPAEGFGLSLSTLTAQITDNDTASVVLTQSSGATSVIEGGSTDTLSYVLTALPSDSVTITLQANQELSLSSTSLIFTPDNWNITQNVTVTAVDDSRYDPMSQGLVSHVVSSDDMNFDGFEMNDVAVDVTDNDSANVVISVTDETTVVAEGGLTDAIKVRLTSKPTQSVGILVVSDAEISVTPQLVIFDLQNWNEDQTVTVRAQDDDEIEEVEASTLSFTVVSDDLDYNGMSLAQVSVSITDNDSSSGDDDDTTGDDDDTTGDDDDTTGDDDDTTGDDDDATGDDDDTTGDDDDTTGDDDDTSGDNGVNDGVTVRTNIDCDVVASFQGEYFCRQSLSDGKYVLTWKDTVIYSEGELNILILGDYVYFTDWTAHNYAGMVASLYVDVLNENEIDFTDSNIDNFDGVTITWGSQAYQFLGYGGAHACDIDGDENEDIVAQAPLAGYGRMYILSGDYDDNQIYLEPISIVEASQTEQLNLPFVACPNLDGDEQDDMIMPVHVPAKRDPKFRYAFQAIKSSSLDDTAPPTFNEESPEDSLIESTSSFNGLLSGMGISEIISLSEGVDLNLDLPHGVEANAISSGDVNHDTFDEVVLADANSCDVYIYYGSSTLESGQTITDYDIIDCHNEYDSASDIEIHEVTGDGIDDIIILFPDESDESNGTIIIIPGSEDGLVTSIDSAVKIEHVHGREIIMIDDQDTGKNNIVVSGGSDGTSEVIEIIDDQIQDGHHDNALDGGYIGGCALKSSQDFRLSIIYQYLFFGNFIITGYFITRKKLKQSHGH